MRGHSIGFGEEIKQFCQIYVINACYSETVINALAVVWCSGGHVVVSTGESMEVAHLAEAALDVVDVDLYIVAE